MQPSESAMITEATIQKSLLDQIAEETARMGARYMPTLTVKQFTEREKLLRELKDMLVPDVDYGTIPGTQKPTLLLPGAQKLCTFFGYVPHYDVRQIEEWDCVKHGEPLFYYDFTCMLLKDGKPVGEGRGSCNSWESKYRYRVSKRTCPNCGVAALIEGKQWKPSDPKQWVCFEKKGGCKAKFDIADDRITSQAVGRVANPDFADVINTCQKMGQKRAYVAATLSATGASQYFTQDMEDAEPIDTGGHPVNTQAAADYVRDQKIADHNKSNMPPVATASAPLNRGQAEQPAGGSPVPDELRVIIADLAKTGGIRNAFDLMRRELGEYLPETGGVEYSRLLIQHKIQPTGGNPIATVRACILDMYEIIQGAKQAAQAKLDEARLPFKASDEDVPALIGDAK